jgi:hypothetical protein
LVLGCHSSSSREEDGKTSTKGSKSDWCRQSKIRNDPPFPRYLPSFFPSLPPPSSLLSLSLSLFSLSHIFSCKFFPEPTILSLQCMMPRSTQGGNRTLPTSFYRMKADNFFLLSSLFLSSPIETRSVLPFFLMVFFVFAELAKRIAAFENELLAELQSEGVDLEKVDIDSVGVDEEMESILQMDDE